MKTMARRAFLIALGGAAVSGCSRSYRLRYRLTAEVEVDGRMISGSSVYEYYDRPRYSWAESLDTGSRHTYGDATVVDLGSRGLLFVTTAKWWWPDPPGVRSVGGDQWAPRDAFRRVFGPSGAPTWRNKIGTRVRLLPNELPILVTFVDPAQPESVKAVAPDDLEASFGPGVALRGVYIEPVRAPITRGRVQAALPWLESWGEERLRPWDRSRKTEELPDQLYAFFFTFRG